MIENKDQYFKEEDYDYYNNIYKNSFKKQDMNKSLCKNKKIRFKKGAVIG